MEPDGVLWRAMPDVYAHATPEEALIEATQSSARWRRGSTYAPGSHMGTLQFDPRYLAMYLSIGVEF